MGYDFRMPSIKGTDREQLAQIRSYLYQFIPQLQMALNALDTTAASNYIAPQQKTVSEPQKTASAVVAFNDLKPLIIKSADIVNAYYEEISSKLEGMYVAESDFGTFLEKTEQEINQSSTEIEQLFTNTQAILTDIENLDFTLAEVNAHIKSGLLYYDDNESPIYGIEIGQKNIVDGEEVFNKYARFISDRLSFYDQNGTEVAYISDYKLYIRSLEITVSIKFGGYVDTVTADGGVITKWVGRG